MGRLGGGSGGGEDLGLQGLKASGPIGLVWSGPKTSLIMGCWKGNPKQRRPRQRKGLAFLKRIPGHRLGGSYYMQMSPHPC